MATGPMKVKVELNPAAVDVLQYVELYVPGCGHQRMNLTPAEAREVCRLLFAKGYGPKAQVLVNMKQYEHLLMQECGHRGHCDYKAGKATHGMRESLRDELIPVLQDYVDEAVRDQREATVSYLEEKLAAGESVSFEALRVKLDQEAARLGKRLDDKFMREVVERKQPPTRGTRDCKGATPVLHLANGDTWVDKQGEVWVCSDAIHDLAPWVNDNDTMQLLAFNTPSGPGMQHCVKLELDHSKSYSLQLDGEPRDSHDALREWLDQDGAPSPAYVTAHVVGKARR